MEIINQSRPPINGSFLYCVYMQIPSDGSFLRVCGFKNYWKAFSEFNRCVCQDGKHTKYILIGSECDPIGSAC